MTDFAPRVDASARTRYVSRGTHQRGSRIVIDVLSAPVDVTRELGTSTQCCGIADAELLGVRRVVERHPQEVDVVVARSSRRVSHGFSVAGTGAAPVCTVAS